MTTPGNPSSLSSLQLTVVSEPRPVRTGTVETDRARDAQLFRAFYQPNQLAMFGPLGDFVHQSDPAPLGPHVAQLWHAVNNGEPDRQNASDKRGHEEPAAAGGESPAIPSPQNMKERQPSQTKMKKICKFCRKNGKPKHIYESHNVRNQNGKVTCPALKQFDCPLCHAADDDAHTLKYCPLYTKVPHHVVMQARWVIYQRNRQNAARRATERAGGARAIQGRQ